MSEANIRQLYRAEMSQALDELEIEEIEWHHARWRQFSSQEDRDKLVTRCLSLPWSICRKDHIPQDFVDDCVQAGNEAIFKAIESWNAQAGMAFTSWAWMYVRRAMMAERTRLNESFGMVDYEAMTTTEDEGDFEDLTGPQILGKLAYSGEEEYAPAWNEDNAAMEAEAQMGQLFDLLEELSDRQREIIIHTIDGLRVAEAAREMGISRMSAGRLLERAVEKLRELTVTNRKSHDIT